MQRNKSWHEVTHTEAFELLPWLLNDTLSPRERAAVEKHIDRCPVCRQELDEQRSVRDLVRESSLVPIPTSRSFNRLLGRIDASETDVNRSRFSRLRRPFLIAATLAAVSMSVLLMIAVFDKPGSQDEFVTLTDSSAHSGYGPTLHVVFASNITEADMRAVLLAAGGEIVSGPTSEGIYTIGIAESSDRSSDFDNMLTQLRTNPRVRLAVRNVEISTE